MRLAGPWLTVVGMLVNGCLLDTSGRGQGTGGAAGSETSTGTADTTTSATGQGGDGGTTGAGSGGAGGTGASGGGGAGGTGGTTGTGGTAGSGDTCPGVAVSVDVQETVILRGDTSVASNEHSSGICGGGAAPDIVYSVTAAERGTLVISVTAASPYLGFVHVRATCNDPSTELGCNDDQVTLPVEAGDTVFVIVDGHEPQPSGAFELQVYLDGCGNEIIDAGEECDDGNADPTDGCAACAVNCSNVGSTATSYEPHLDEATLHCYLLVYNANRNWQGAHDDCVAWGGHLAVLATTVEINSLAAVLDNSGEDVWIGGHDITTEGSFEWVTGEPWIYVNGQSPWYSQLGSEPNGGTDENCVEIFPNGTLNDESCSQSHNYLCERSPAGVLP